MAQDVMIARPNRRLCDPITLEIVRGVLRTTMHEMDALIERTAMSPFIREKKDFHTGLYDGDGRLVYSSSMSVSDALVATVLNEFPPETMRQGDLYWFNDCYASRGSVTHSPDQVFLRPVFAGDRIIAFVEGWAHFSDIGGMRPGSLSADCTDIFQEGIIVPPVRLLSAGVVQSDLLRMFCRNSRYPDMILGDVRALMAATGLGEARLGDAAARFGDEVLGDAFEQLIEWTARDGQAQMKQLFPVGRYTSTETVDSDGQGNGPFKLRYTLIVEDGRIVLDTTESDDQAPGPVNFLLNPGTASSFLGDFVLSGTSPYVPNHGLLSVLDEVSLRPGSILQPRFPAPLGFRGGTMMRQLVGLMGLVALATNGQSNASFSSYVIFYLRGTTDAGKPFLLSDGIGVGYGARTYADGNDAIYISANENYPCEFVEINYPMRVRRYAINPDTGGPGRYRGGCGVIRELEVMTETALLGTRIDSIRTPPWGVNGGMAGRPGGCWINPGTDRERYVEGVSDGTVVHRGDIVRVATAGGGGWGHPYDREPERVLSDVLDGFVSVASAAADYGVELDVDAETVDWVATMRRRADRPATKLFHQNGYKELLG